MTDMRSRLVPALASTLCVLVAACSSDSTNLTNGSGAGVLTVQLTDAPFSTDSVKSVNIFVVRVDARTTTADSAAADSDVDTPAAGGWQTIATPNASFDLLNFQHGTIATLGEATVAAGTYDAVRLIIDPTQSSVMLKNGQVLTTTSSPSVTFPSAAHSGLKINLSQPITITGGAATTLLVDFDVNNSFVMRGNSINKNGLLFKPVINASVTNAANVVATVALVNATDATLNLLQSGTVLANGSAIPFGGVSSCTTVLAANPMLTVTQGSSTTALAGFTPTLAAGTSYEIIAYPTASAGTAFATLTNTFTPANGLTGLRVFNATTSSTGFDVYLTPLAPVLGAATVTNVAAGAISSWVSVGPGNPPVRITSTGSTTVVLDLGTQALIAGKDMTLVIAPAAAGSTTPRAFLVTGC